MEDFVALWTKIHLILSVFLGLNITTVRDASNITLSPLGIVSVNPGGQVQLTCEIAGPYLYWNVSTHRVATTYERIVTDSGSGSGVLSQPEFRIGFTEFNITRTSKNPLISQLLINNVTTKINGSTIYCSDDGNETNAPMTTINVMYRVTCDYPPIQSSHCHIEMTGSQDIHPLIEGQFITYTCTCPPGFVLSGPNISVCTRNGNWEPELGEVVCIADCGIPALDRNIVLNYTSTLDGSVLMLTCENDTSRLTHEQINIATCHSSGKWIPDPTQFTCSSLTSVPPGAETTHHPPHSSEDTRSVADLGVVTGLSVLGIIVITGATVIVITILCLIKKGYLPPKRVNRLPGIQLENAYHSHVENSSQQPDPVQQQDTLVYAKIGPSSFKKRAKHVVALPADTDDRVEYALVNHSLQKRFITIKQNSMADDSLNLDTLLIQLRGAVTSYWHQLGEALEVEKDVLDRCSNYPPEESIVEILDLWLRNFPGRPTWHDVSNALRKVGLQQLASDIEKVYETGKLPIQVEHDDAQQAFTMTALELPQPEEERKFNDHHDEDESAPPLPPKPLAGSDVPTEMLAPLRPPKYMAK